MMNMNSGYVGYRMSVNASNAYATGEKPLSKWTKQDFLDAYGEAVRPLTVPECRENFLYNSSWHHTSEYCNHTEFYSLEDPEDVNVAEIVNRVLSERKPKESKSKEIPASVPAKIVFEEWEGSRSYGKFVKHEEYAVIVGNWAYTLYGKKSITGKHILNVEQYSRAPRGTAAVFSQISKKIQ